MPFIQNTISHTNVCSAGPSEIVLSYRFIDALVGYEHQGNTQKASFRKTENNLCLFQGHTVGGLFTLWA